MPKRKTHEEFVEELKNINPHIKIAGSYVGATTKVKCCCLICGHEWMANPFNLLQGTGCPECARCKRSKIQKKSHEDFISDVKLVNPNINVVGRYINNKTKIKCRCLICDNEWDVVPTGLLQGYGCPRCAGNKKRTHEVFINEMKNVNSNIRIIDKYINSNIKVKCSCVVCGNEWSARPQDLLRGHGCPNCTTSKGEQKIERFLRDNNISYIAQKKFDNLRGVNGGKLSYDFYVPHYNILIEFNGEQHKMSLNYFGGEDRFAIQQEHDKRKREYAKIHNIDLLEIWYCDLNAIEQLLEDKLQRYSICAICRV